LASGALQKWAGLFFYGTLDAYSTVGLSVSFMVQRSYGDKFHLSTLGQKPSDRFDLLPVSLPLAVVVDHEQHDAPAWWS